MIAAAVYWSGFRISGFGILSGFEFRPSRFLGSSLTGANIHTILGQQFSRVSDPKGVWTRRVGCPKNLLHFVFASVEDTARSIGVGHIFRVELVVF